MGLEQIQVSPPAPGEVLDLAGLFGSDGPVELEIGIGKGGFLLAQARARPGVNFLGVEWANEFYQYASDRMRRWGVRNVRTMRTDARNLVLYHLAPESLAAVYIFHPDPWPKRRHQKRRLIQGDFLRALARAMQAGARLTVQTDHAEYFAWMLEAMKECPALEMESEVAERVLEAEETPGTNFEVKYRREGRRIYGFVARRGED